MEITRDTNPSLTDITNPAPMTQEQVEAILDDPDICECCKADALRAKNWERLFEPEIAG
jgi:hypothetical protein